MASTQAVGDQAGRLPDEMLAGMFRTLPANHKSCSWQLAHFAGLKGDSIIIPRSSFTVDEEIGRGAFSKVYKGTYRGVPVAIKKQTISEENPEKYLMTELGILQ